MHRRTILISVITLTSLALGTPAPAQQWQHLGFSGDAVNTVFVHPEGMLFVGTWMNGLQRSDDGGETWIPLGDLPDGSVSILTIDPQIPSRMYASVSGTNDQGGPLFRSDDDGASWHSASGDLPSSRAYSLAIDPRNPMRLYAGITRVGVFRSTDGGESWTSHPEGFSGAAHSVVVHPRRSSRILGGSYGAGVFQSNDRGRTWAAARRGLPNASRVYSLAIDPERPRIVYATVANHGVFRSFNGGSTWKPRSTGLPTRRVTVLAIDPQDTRSVFVGTSIAGVFKTRNGGRKWNSVDPESFGEASVGALVIDPSTSTLYAATSDGLLAWDPEPSATR